MLYFREKRIEERYVRLDVDLNFLIYFFFYENFVKYWSQINLK